VAIGYQGTSNSADSLLIWTRGLRSVSLDDAFIGAGCAGQHEPVPAVTVAAGAIWGEVYDAVTTKGRRDVQGGGCLTVGVAGLIQSGGFGSFSKAYGMAAASLLEAEIFTADGAVGIANPCTNPDLFWAIKGGGGGSLGAVTRLTLRTHTLPEFFGAVLTGDQGNIGRRLPPPDHADHQLLPREPLQFALGRPDRVSAEQGSRNRNSPLLSRLERFLRLGMAAILWASNYLRLLAVKDHYDPDGLFFVHHGVGSERWSADGFTRLA
jgi:FAD/FMN-containing dehydrogenase